MDDQKKWGERVRTALLHYGAVDSSGNIFIPRQAGEPLKITANVIDDPQQAIELIEQLACAILPKTFISAVLAREVLQKQLQPKQAEANPLPEGAVADYTQPFNWDESKVIVVNDYSAPHVVDLTAKPADPYVIPNCDHVPTQIVEGKVADIDFGGQPVVYDRDGNPKPPIDCHEIPLGPWQECVLGRDQMQPPEEKKEQQVFEVNNGVKLIDVSLVKESPWPITPPEEKKESQ